MNKAVVFSVMLLVLSLTVGVTPLASAADPGPVNKQVRQLDAVNDQLSNAETKLVKVTLDPGPVNKQVRQLDAVADHLTRAQTHLTIVSGELDPGPVQDRAILAQLNNIITQSNGIANTATQFENSPGSVNNPTVIAQLNDIINEATIINIMAGNDEGCPPGTIDLGGICVPVTS